MIIIIINKLTKPETTTTGPTKQPPLPQKKTTTTKTAIETIKTLEIVSENHCPNTFRPSSTLSPSGALVLRV